MTPLLVVATLLFLYGLGSYAQAVQGRFANVDALVYLGIMPVVVFLLLLQPACVNDRCAGMAESLVSWDPTLRHSMEQRAFLQRYLTSDCYTPQFRLWGWRLSVWSLGLITLTNLVPLLVAGIRSVFGL